MTIPHLTSIKLTFMHLYCNLLIKKFLFIKLTSISASPHNNLLKIHFLQSENSSYNLLSFEKIRRGAEIVRFIATLSLHFFF